MIRKANAADRETYLAMAKEFYDSPAVAHKVPAKHFADAFDEALRSDAYVELYMLTDGDDVCGYALTAKTYSQEAGGLVVWLDELYLMPAYRSRGLGREFFAYVEREIPAARFRLEVEPDNVRAKALYTRLGYEVLPYEQMYKERSR